MVEVVAGLAGIGDQIGGRTGMVLLWQVNPLGVVLTPARFRFLDNRK
jgi:hypothetical protein